MIMHLSLLLKYYDYLFKDLPILFTGINDFDKSLLTKDLMNYNMSGVVEQVDLEKKL